MLILDPTPSFLFPEYRTVFLKYQAITLTCACGAMEFASRMDGEALIKMAKSRPESTRSAVRNSPDTF